MEILLNNLTDIIVAIIGAYFLYLSNKQKKATEEEKQRAEERKRESLLALAMSEANTELTICLALNMIHDDYPVCDIENALEKARKAQENYNNYLQEQAKKAMVV